MESVKSEKYRMIAVILGVILIISSGWAMLSNANEFSLTQFNLWMSPMTFFTLIITLLSEIDAKRVNATILAFGLAAMALVSAPIIGVFAFLFIAYALFIISATYTINKAEKISRMKKISKIA